jgi:hypothetical protein
LPNIPDYAMMSDGLVFVKSSPNEKFLMISDESTQAAAYELSPPKDIPLSPETGSSEKPFSESLLVHNVSWFCQFRWLVIVILLTYGVAGQFGRLIEPFGIRPPGVCPFVTAAVLVVSNITFLYLAQSRTW